MTDWKTLWRVRLTAFAMVFSVIALSSCTTPAAQTASQPSQAAAESVAVDRFTVPGQGSVNTWFLVGPDGIVVVDFQRDLDSARGAVERARTIGKPVRALLVTHAHPDHIGGIEAFKKAFPDAPLYATQRTADEIRSDSHGYQRLTKQLFKDKAPVTYPVPDRILKDRDHISVSGVDIEVREWGPGESESATMYYVPLINALFSGDVVANHVTDFLLEGRTAPWLDQLRSLKPAYLGAHTVYPGHGDSGGFDELLQDSAAYLEAFRAAVKAEMSGPSGPQAELSPAAAQRVVERVEKQFPNRPRVAAIPNLIELNAAAVAKELLSAQSGGPENAVR